MNKDLRPLVTFRTVKRFFAYGRGFNSAERAWQYCAKREISKFSKDHSDRPYGFTLPELFPLASCPLYENTSCSDYGRPFCFCRFKRWLTYRGAALGTGAPTLEGDELEAAIKGFAGLRVPSAPSDPFDDGLTAYPGDESGITGGEA